MYKTNIANSARALTQHNMTCRSGERQILILGIYIFCYFLVSLSFLTEFPFVHSDESWLSGLTRNMLEQGDLGVTETFYDLKPRYPHAIKILFHLLQMPMLAVFQYNVFAFRLLSLVFACITLILFYLLLSSIFRGTAAGGIWGLPFLGTVLLSLNVQFIYASHFARQEIILAACIVACFLAMTRDQYLIAGLITGLSIGLHPNSFLIGTMCTAMLVPWGVKMRGFDQWKPLLGYAGVTSAFAVFFVSLSLSFDREFFKHYLAYGNSEFDIGAPVTSKLMELPYFFEKIWYGVSATYYVPDIRFDLVLFALSCLILLILFLMERMGKKTEAALTGKGIAGMLAGMVIIGRYNQTSIVFLFPLFLVAVLLAADGIADCLGRRRLYLSRAAAAVLIIVTAALSFVNISPWLNHSHENYLNEISKAVDPGDKVLANLNAEYYFDNGKLMDYRNLSFLKSEGMTVEEYIRENKIEFIILSDEMDLIYSQRPIWNMIYGNLRYMNELQRFLDQNCVRIHKFQDNTYGVRIIQYMNSDRNFTVQIFKVKDLP